MNAPALPLFTRPLPAAVESARATRGTGGNQRRRAREDRAALGRYLTPMWVWDWFFARFEPLPGTTICDPCCAGYAGFTAGGRWARLHGREAELSDLAPLSGQCRESGAPIAERDVFRAAWPRRRRTILTNCDYEHAEAFVTRFLRLADEVCVVMRSGYLFAGGGRRIRGLHSWWQPSRRMAFELLPEEGERRLAHNADLDRRVAGGELTAAEADRLRLDVHRDPDTATGYRCSASGVDHGILVFRRGYEGVPGLIVEGVDAPGGQAPLFAAERRRVTSDAALAWGALPPRSPDAPRR